MEAQEIINIIQTHSLTVRCLPHKVINHWSYREGDEDRCNQPSYDSNGNIRNVKKSVVFSESLGRKVVREERDIEKGGWWYVKETKNTDSQVHFNRKYDKFFAPSLEEAIELYLKSIT